MVGRRKLKTLDGKVAIVTGAGSVEYGHGTGDAMAINFARHGARVVLFDIDEERANRTLKTINQERGIASIVIGDVSKAADCDLGTSVAVEQFGNIDILVNNVAIIPRGNVVDVTEEEWDQVFAVNLKSMMLMSKSCIKYMVSNGGGSIINISSTEGQRGQDWLPFVAYSTSKGAAVTLTTSMAVQHGKDNIRVNCIAPGMIYTPLIAPHISEEVRTLRRMGAPLDIEGNAWDVANAAVFLASDNARWITGTTLPVDGGLLATQSLSLIDRFTDLAMK